jgi:hypothetical protein
MRGTIHLILVIVPASLVVSAVLWPPPIGRHARNGSAPNAQLTRVYDIRDLIAWVPDHCDVPVFPPKGGQLLFGQVEEEDEAELSASILRVTESIQEVLEPTHATQGSAQSVSFRVLGGNLIAQETGAVHRQIEAALARLRWWQYLRTAGPGIALATCGSVTLVLVTRGLFVRRQRATRQNAGLCVACGYDLRASRGQCPECGSYTESRLAQAPPSEVTGCAT